MIRNLVLALGLIMVATENASTQPTEEQLRTDWANLASMAELAKENGIRAVMSSVLPVYDYPWKPGLEPAPKIIALNKWMKDYADHHHAIYLDYHSAMADARGGMREGLASDGVHPNEAGYRVMAPLVEQAIERALRAK